MENRLFNPYGFNFGGGPIGGFGAFPPSTYDFFSSPAAIKDFWDSQYLYYRYLNEMLDYTKKVKEFEKTDSNKS